jgi:hypothetical protein
MWLQSIIFEKIHEEIGNVAFFTFCANQKVRLGAKAISFSVYLFVFRSATRISIITQTHQREETTRIEIMSNPEEIAKAFAQHYYNVFDNDRKSLANLYVSPISFLNLVGWLDD